MLFNEPKLLKSQLTIVTVGLGFRFSALQRAEIAEILLIRSCEPSARYRFSALQRAEIAEIIRLRLLLSRQLEFQCSSTSRNC